MTNPPEPSTQSRIEQIIGISSVALLVIGCFMVLRPFVSTVIWAAILSYSTWPIYRWLLGILKGRSTLAAMLMTILVALVLVAPFMIVGMSLAENVRYMVGLVRSVLHEGAPDPPLWLERLPIVGDSFYRAWADLSHNSDKLIWTVKDLLGRSREWLVSWGVDLGHGILQLSLSVFVAFFFYRDGSRLGIMLEEAMHRISGNRAKHLMEVTGGTVRGVVYGILGTALAQGILAGVGFWIAGIPAPLLLGLLTFFLSLVPMGPPLVWIPATIWLFYGGHTGWGIFLGIWGTGVVSSVDNFLKPYIISRGSNLPFVLVFLGVLGGIIAFGFIGVFLGPTLLAVGYSLVLEWNSQGKGDHA